MQTINLKRLNIQPQQRILDLGCGEGRHAHAISLLSQAHVFAVDIALEDVKKIKPKLQPFATDEQLNRCHIVASDGLVLPFSDNSFDMVICSEVLEHIPNYHGMLAEIQRTLKPNGTLAISVPRAWPEQICWWLSREYHQVEGGHIRIFNAKQLQQTVVKKGFTYTQKHWAHALHTPFWWLRCLLWRRGEHTFLVRVYHKLLVWDLLKKPALTRWLEKALNPFMGKSVVMYFTKNAQSQSQKY